MGKKSIQPKLDALDRQILSHSRASMDAFVERLREGDQRREAQFDSLGSGKPCRSKSRDRRKGLSSGKKPATQR